MTTRIYGITPQGFNPMRLTDVKSELENLFIAEFGDINLDPQSVAGQIIGIFSKVFADDWENLQDVYSSQYPNSAFGISLDNVVQLNGLTRLPELQTSVIGAATGIQGTLIPAGSLARLTASTEIFYSTINAFITSSNAIANSINVLSVTAQQYTVLVSGRSFIYSLPTIAFAGPIVSGNTISMRVNGVNAPLVPFVTDSTTTLNNLATALLTNFPSSIASASVVANTVKLVPVLGSQIIINSLEVSGPGAPTSGVVFEVPASVDDVAQYLAANIDSSTTLTGSWTIGSTFNIQSTSSSSPYSLAVGSNLKITSVTSPVPFLAQTYGPIPAPANTLTQIMTPIAGWQSLTNFDAGVTGRFQETDSELRLRRAQSLHLLGAATVEAIRARVLQEVDGVTSVTVFENVTMKQSDIIGLFSSDFIAGTSVEARIDSILVGTATYVSSHLQVMNDLTTLLETNSNVENAVLGGTGNRQITVSIISGVEIELGLTTLGANAPSVVVSGGRPPKSFETVVEGGLDDAVALKIWQLKPAGIATFGNTHVNIVDSQGNPQGINFTRATPIYIWTNVSLTLNPQETFPSNGQELVSESILAYGNSLGIGIDVFIQRVQAACFTVPGIASATVQLARTISESETPSYTSLDIDIQETEISAWSLGRINVSI